MRISKHTSVSYNLYGNSGGHMATLRAEIREGGGVVLTCDVHDKDAVEREVEAFATAKTAFRAEAEALAGRMGAVML